MRAAKSAALAAVVAMAADSDGAEAAADEVAPSKAEAFPAKQPSKKSKASAAKPAAAKAGGEEQATMSQQADELAPGVGGRMWFIWSHCTPGGAVLILHILPDRCYDP